MSTATATATATATFPNLMDSKDVKRMLEIMNNPKAIVTLIHEMDAMQGKLDKALDDLNSIKEVLTVPQRKSFQQGYERAADATRSGIQAARESFSKVRTTFLDNVKKVLDTAKTKGAAGLEKILNVAGVKAALLNTQENINRSIQSTEKSIDKVHALGSEYHAMGYHAKRMLKTMANKEIEGGIKGNGKINALLKKPFVMAKQSMESARHSVEKCLTAIDRIEQEAQRGRSQSVQKQLAAHKPQPSKAVDRSSQNLAHER